MTATVVKSKYEITPETLKALIDLHIDAVTLVDIRDHGAYRQGHLPDACCVPLEELEENEDYLPKDKLIVAYCEGGACGQSLRAALELAQRGYRAQHLAGGLTEWTRRGFPVEASSQAW